MKYLEFAVTCRLAAVIIVLLAATAGSVPSAHGAEGGSSHYGPGFYGDFGVAVAPDPGIYLRNDLYYYTADAGGKRIVQHGELRVDLEVDSAMYMLTGLKALDTEILGGRYLFGAFLPLIYAGASGSVVLEPESTSFDADRTALGDLGVIPASLFWNFGNVHINAYEIVTAPTGSYDVERDINSGLNYWSFDTVLAATYLHPEKGHEISAAFGYAFNTENDDTDYKTGQEFHVDYMLNQFFSETFALGLQGFYYKQTTGDSGSGALLGDFKGEAAGLGPALMWTTQVGEMPLILGAKWIHEFHAEHRLEGDHLFLNLTLAF